MQKITRNKKLKFVLIAGLCLTLSAAPLNTHARTNRTSGTSDDAAEVLMEDARETRNEENLYREAVSGHFSVEILEEIIERGYLRNHIDELKILGYLSQSYGATDTEEESGSRNVIAGGTNQTASEPSDQTGTTGNTTQNRGNNFGSSGSQGSGSTNTGNNASGGHYSGNSGSSDSSSSGTKSTGGNVSNGTDQTSQTGSLEINEDAVNALGDAADTADDGDTAEENKDNDNDSDNLDGGDSSKSEYTTDAMDIDTKEIRSIRIISSPTDTTYGTAIVQKTDGTSQKVYYDEDWIESQDKTKITYEEGNDADSKEAEGDTAASFRIKSVIPYMATAAVLAIAALIFFLVIRRKEKKEQKKLQNVNF